MGIVLMVLGAAVSLGALAFWVYLNAMAAAWHTSNTTPSIQWLTEEAFTFFWLPFAAGLAIAFTGWKRRPRSRQGSS
ncbi:hypothetical protein [Pelagibius sp. 7325]|uniref:hypothetical protein n=1 Tax=Pelagibius sp. 7325 TaxID=3131994 RepID=UPI0030EEB915